MVRFGIPSHNAYGVPAPYLKKTAKRLGQNHELAQKLWATGVREARHLAALIDPPEAVTSGQMDRWARDFDSWDLTDGVCCHLFVYSPLAWKKALQWPNWESEMVRRAGFSLMAWLAIHDKAATNAQFESCFQLVVKYSQDERHYVKKAANWALRQIGKRNSTLRQEAIVVAERLRGQESASARWIGGDALKELRRPLPSNKRSTISS
jgi:3-methyladenine DNA glycosylase AlkD